MRKAFQTLADLQQLPELKRFVRAKGVVTIPGPEEAEVDESPPYHRWKPAYFDIPGAFDKGLPAIYYVAPPDPAWSRAEREAYIPGRGYPAVYLGPRGMARAFPSG